MTHRSILNTLGQKVIAVDTAEDIGEVKAFVVSPHVDRVERLQVAGRRKHALFADWDDLESFGADAVMVSSAEAPAETDDQRDTDTAKGSIDIIGARILDTVGFEHGTVSDLTFDADTGAIISIEGPEGTVDASLVHSLGSYAVVIDH